MINFDAVKDLLYRLADDELIIGHRNSEWNGIGPILEEDIAFSSMAQDEMGHAQAYYIMLHEMIGEAHPDQIAFNRNAADFRSCQLVEHPIVDYAFSLVRHFCYDIAETIRLDSLRQSSFKPLAELAKKIGREEKYHQLHAITWISQLGRATDESNRRLQEALNIAYPLAFSLFEPTAMDESIASEGLMARESELEAAWVAEMEKQITASNLKVPEVADKTAFYGGRTGKHSEHLPALLTEMTEVFAIDPEAAW